MIRHLLRGVVPAALAAAVLSAPAKADPTVIELTQTACQFVESENGVERGFSTTAKADCERINDQTGDDRLAESEVIELAPGDYVFRVTNRDVDYPLGFWLRGKGLGRVTLPSVSGGGLTTGATKDYKITLAPGEYHYSCPLNSTPDYTLIVTEG